MIKLSDDLMASITDGNKDDRKFDLDLFVSTTKNSPFAKLMTDNQNYQAFVTKVDKLRSEALTFLYKGESKNELLFDWVSAILNQSLGLARYVFLRNYAHTHGQTPVFDLHPHEKSLLHMVRTGAEELTKILN